MNKPWIRVVAFIAVFIFVAVLPWWISVIPLIILTMYYPMYIEVVFFGFMFDSLYSIKTGFLYPGLVLSTAFLLITMYAKTILRR